MRALPEVWSWSIPRHPWHGIAGHNTVCNSCAGLGLPLIIVAVQVTWLAQEQAYSPALAGSPAVFPCWRQLPASLFLIMPGLIGFASSLCSASPA